MCAARPEQNTGEAAPLQPQYLAVVLCRLPAGRAGNTVSMHAATVAYEARPRLRKRRPAYPADPGVGYFVSVLTEACPAKNPALDSALPPMLHPPVCKASSPPVLSRSMCCICHRSLPLLHTAAGWAAAHALMTAASCRMPKDCGGGLLRGRRVAAGGQRIAARTLLHASRQGLSQLADVSSGRGATAVGRRTGGDGLSRRW